MMKVLFSARGFSGWWAVFLAAFVLFVGSASGQINVKGAVVNGTTGRPVPGVMLTLITFAGGMDPVEEVVSGPDGTFAFEKALSATGRQPMLGMVRAEYEGVPYSKIIPADSAGNLQVDVYSVDEGAPRPTMHIVIFEPSESELAVSETFMLTNTETPPRTFRNAEKGTVQFYVPPAAGGTISVQTAGPQGMPLQSVADPTNAPDVYKIDFAVKPGENRVDISYTIPHSDGDAFVGKVLYDELPTRIAAPTGVTLEGGDITSLGREPNTQAELFDGPATREYKIAAIRGVGRLRPPAEEASGGGGSGAPRVAPAPITVELYWLLALTGGILVAGFVYLYTSRLPVTGVSPAATASRQTGRGRRKS
jgi:hypothetical protein